MCGVVLWVGFFGFVVVGVLGVVLMVVLIGVMLCDGCVVLF